MDKKYDFSDFDEPVKQDAYDFSDFDEPVEVTDSEPEDQLSTAQAYGVGAIQGSTLGTAPIASGLGGAFMNAIEQLGGVSNQQIDSPTRSGVKLSPTADQLDEGVRLADLPSLSPKLREKLGNKVESFIQPDQKTGLEGLLSEYYDSRNRMKDLQDTAHEESPWAAGLGNLTGGMATSIASAGVTGPLSSMLPSASRVLAPAANAGKARQLLSSVATGIREGAKAGALTGFGSGDAELLRGDVSNTLKETASSTVGGALIGGAIPLGIEGLKGAKDLTVNTAKAIIPGLKSYTIGRTVGKAGHEITEESIDQLTERFGGGVLKKLNSVFAKANMDKQDAMDAINELSERVDAGEVFDEAIKKVKAGAFKGLDQKEKNFLLEVLNDLKDPTPDPVVNKAQLKLDNAQAKNIQKIQAKYGDDAILEESDVVQDYVQDLVPQTNSEAKVLGAKQTFSVPKKPIEVDGVLQEQEPMVLERFTQQVDNMTPPKETVPVHQYDINNMQLNQLERLLKEVNRYTGVRDTSPIQGQDSQNIMKVLAGKLRGLSDEAFENALNKTDINKDLRNTLAAIRKADIDDKFFSRNEFDQNDVVDSIKKMVTEGDRTKAKRFFEYMKRVDPTFEADEKYGKFLKEALKVGQNADRTLNASSESSLMGSASGRISRIGNAQGRLETKFADKAKDFYNFSGEKVQELANKFNAPNAPKAAQTFIAPLMKAAELPDARRAVILYGIYQQPAFREMYQSLGEDTLDMLPYVGETEENDN